MAKTNGYRIGVRVKPIISEGKHYVTKFDFSTWGSKRVEDINQVREELHTMVERVCTKLYEKQAKTGAK